MKVYIDDMLVKNSKNPITYKIWMMPLMHFVPNEIEWSKCVFGVTTSKFLRFLVTRQGIKTNSKKIKVILEMKHLTSKKEVQ